MLIIKYLRAKPRILKQLDEQMQLYKHFDIKNIKILTYRFDMMLLYCNI